MGLGDAAAGLGLHHQDFLPKSLSTMKHCFFRRHRRDINEAHFRAFWRQALLGMPPMLQNAVNIVKNCCAEPWAVVLPVLLLLRLARALRGPCFFPVGFRAFWRARATPATKRCYLRCFVAFEFPAWLAGCSFWAPLSGASGARARPHLSLLGWGPAGAQKAGIPGIIWGWGGQHAQPNHVSHTKNMT